MRRAFVLALVAAVGCVVSQRYGTPFAPARFDREPGWTAVRGVPLVLQRRELDCGAAATAMVLRFWDKAATADELRRASGIPDDRGLTAGFLRDHLRARGLEAYLIEGSVDDLAHELAAHRPVLVGIVRERVAHYQVVIGIDRARELIVVVDPVGGWLQLSLASFERAWAPSRRLTLVAFPPA